MLISFSVANCLSFNEKVELNLLAVGSDKELLSNVSECPTNKTRGAKNLPLLKSAIIYGPNASGKSNLLRALKMMVTYVWNSHERKYSLPQFYFMLNPDNENRPSEFELKVLLNGSVYRYGFTFNSDLVLEEWLFKADKGPEKLIFTREFDREKKTPTFNFGPSGTGQFKGLESKVRSDALLLLVGAMFNAHDAVIISDYFSNVAEAQGSSSGLWGTPQASYYERYPPTENELTLLGEILKVADIGIDRLELFERQPARVSSDKSIQTQEKAVLFIYKNSKNEDIAIIQEFQSEGTRALLNIFLPIIRKYSQGGLFLCDELERSLHPMLAELVVKLFHILPGNKSQFIATTHNTGLINSDLFRRDQVWLMEKDQSGQSGLVSLADFQGVRKGAKLGKQYLEGLFGGLPFLNETRLKEILAELSSSDQED